jgi:hypothetical protein
LKINSLCLLILFSVWACKPTADSQLNTSSETNEKRNSLTLAIQESIAPEIRILFDGMTEFKDLSLRQLDMGAVQLNSILSSEIKFKYPTKGSGSRVRSKNRRKAGYNSYTEHDTYRSIKLGSRGYIFKLEKQPKFQFIDKWKLVTWFATSILNDEIAKKYTGLANQTRYVLDTKIYEPKRIAHRLELVDNVEFVASFLPGYVGYKRMNEAKTTGDTIVGLAEYVGDLASLGLGSKFRVVQKIAGTLVIGGGAIRITAAASKALRKEAHMEDGISALLATVEIGLASVTMIKLKISGSKAFVRSSGHAEVLAKKLGRNADEIFANGISKKELKSLVGDLDQLDLLDVAGKKFKVKKRPGISGMVPNPKLNAQAKELAGFFDQKITKIQGVNMIDDTVSPEQFKTIANKVIGTGEEGIFMVAYENNLDVGGLVHWMTVHVRKDGSWIGRHAGALSFNRGKLIIKPVQSLRHGVVIKPKLADDELELAIKNFYLEPRSKISCVQDACSAIQIKKANASPVFVRNNVKKIMDGGLEINGRKLEFDYFKLSNANNKQIAKQIIFTDVKASASSVFVGTVAIIAPIVIADEIIEHFRKD